MNGKQTPIDLALDYYGRFARVADQGQSALLLLIRVYIGYQCAKAGYNHLIHYQKTVEFFRGWHVPMPEINVGIAGITELVGGSLLLVGFMSRLVAIPLTFNFLVAILAVNLSDPHGRELLASIWTDQDVVIKDTAFPFFFTAVLILFFGPGWYSIDGMIRRMRRSKTP